MAIQYTILGCIEAQVDAEGVATDNSWVITFQWNDPAVPHLTELMQVDTTATTVDADTLPQYRTKCDDAVKAYLGLP